MGDMEKNALQVNGTATYRSPMLAELLDDCDALGLDPDDVEVQGRVGFLVTLTVTALGEKGRDA